MPDLKLSGRDAIGGNTAAPAVGRETAPYKPQVGLPERTFVPMAVQVAPPEAITAWPTAAGGGDPSGAVGGPPGDQGDVGGDEGDTGEGDSGTGDSGGEE